MTGFDRPNRSYYLDCMDVQVGDLVICTCAGMTPDQRYTVGKTYAVYEGKRIYNDVGDFVHPSVRFKHYE